MRITAGKYGGRVLKSPKDKRVRPTSDKVRQAVFNILGGYGLPAGAYVMDGFCGTGALGIEALSRGAAFVDFIDISRESLALCRDNLVTMGVSEAAYGLARKNLGKDTITSGSGKKHDLIFLDPPYDLHITGNVLQLLSDSGTLQREAVCVVETALDEEITAPGFFLTEDRRYGDTRIRFFRAQP